LAATVDALIAMLPLNLAVLAALLWIDAVTNPPPKTPGWLPDALYALGVKYANGDGVTKDPQTAADLFSRAAEGGHAKAQSSLCWIYIRDRGCGATTRRRRGGASRRRSVAKHRPNTELEFLAGRASAALRMDARPCCG